MHFLFRFILQVQDTVAAQIIILHSSETYQIQFTLYLQIICHFPSPLMTASSTCVFPYSINFDKETERFYILLTVHLVTNSC